MKNPRWITHIWLTFLLVFLSLLPLRVSSANAQTLQTPVGFEADQPEMVQATLPRRVNIPSLGTNNALNWSQSAIFWLGINESYQAIPGRNYTNVRIAYNQAGLHVFVTVVDYYLWYDQAQNPGDLTQYDAVAIYLDTAHDRTAAPQTDDYYFLVGARHWETVTKYQRQARGNGTGWNTAWSATWTQNTGMSWSDTGPNDNSGNIDYGWVAEIHLPWSALGRSGPPAQGALWGLGVRVYDRDNSGSGGMAQAQSWPEAFNPNSPASWADLHFGDDAYQPPAAQQSGTVTIRATSPSDNTVQDAWMGGGGWCQAGHEGGGEQNHGDDPELYLGAEAAPTHLPCFNKSFLRFALNSVPAGKVILSAKMTLYHWGNAGEPSAPRDEDHGHDSFSWVYTIRDPWDEMTIHWNNAPLAAENLDVQQIKVLTAFPGWDKLVAYEWDITKAVAEAYQSGQPVSLAVFDSATERNTSKYMVASETGDWNANNRPKLTIVYGTQASSVSVAKKVNQPRPSTGANLTYTLNWTGIGKALTLTDTLPQGLAAPTNLQASSGVASYNPSTRQITWTGSPAAGQAVQLTYQCAVQATGPSSLTNTAVLSGDGATSTAQASVCVGCLAVYLPLLRR